MRRRLISTDRLGTTSLSFERWQMRTVANRKMKGQDAVAVAATAVAGRSRNVRGAAEARQVKGSTARSQDHIRKQVEVGGGQRFVVLLRGGEECEAVQALLAAGYGKTRMEVVRRALVKAASALKKGAR